MRPHHLVLGGLAVAVLASPALAQPRPRPGKLDVAKATAAVGGGDVAAAVTAATALGAAKESAAREALLDALATGVHPDVAIAGLSALGAAGAKDALEVVPVYQRHRNPAVRAAALKLYVGLSGDVTAIAGGLRSFDAPVRAVAADAAGDRGLTATVPALLVLLDKGEVPAARALGKLGDELLFRTVAEHFGVAPDQAVALALGGMLAKPGFGPEPARVDLVRMLSKLSGVEALDALEAYVKATPANPPRQSRREAEAVLTARQAGDR